MEKSDFMPDKERLNANAEEMYEVLRVTRLELKRAITALSDLRTNISELIARIDG